jgi:hypothetical protein
LPAQQKLTGDCARTGPIGPSRSETPPRPGLDHTAEYVTSQ